MATLVKNKNTRREYEVLETLEAGIELLGGEVKSLRVGLGSLAGARISVRGGEAYLVGAHIPPYQPKNAPPEYDPERSRRLLLSKRQIAELADVENRKGLTTIPLSVYTKGRTVKLEVATARGLKKYDKREKIKKRDTDRDIARTLKIK